MVQALYYKDEKSDKFWRVETDGCVMAVNWGRTGTNGRRQLAGYETEEQCEKEAAKMAASKIKKGYKPVSGFDWEGQEYFDLDEFGPNRLTSHPLFRKYFSDDMYYDCADEEAVFGSDEGSDTLAILQGEYRSDMDMPSFPRNLIEKEWGMTWLPPDVGQTEDELRKQADGTFDSLPGDQVILMNDQVILAAAFGQIKICGKLDAQLQAMAFASLDRMESMYRLIWNSGSGVPCVIEMMRRDLRRFVDEVLN